ncbi:MAG: hypothetical protein ACHQAY_00140 [Hyphomicrobiales bacterium]
MLHKYRFRPKTFGYATPSTWEGWAFTGAYVFAVTIAFFVLLTSKHELRSIGAWVVFIIFVLCLTAIFVLFRKASAQGDWRLRSGQDNP